MPPDNAFIHSFIHEIIRKGNRSILFNDPVNY
jgi:hypothetical protein